MQDPANTNPIARRLMFIAGFVCLGLGVIGLIMPMMPGAFFLFLAAFFFSRSSERFHDWLIGHRHFGPLVEAFRDGSGMPRALRRRILLIMWGSMAISMVLIAKWWAVVLLLSCGALASVFLMRQRVY